MGLSCDVIGQSIARFLSTCTCTLPCIHTCHGTGLLKTAEHLRCEFIGNLCNLLRKLEHSPLEIRKGCVLSCTLALLTDVISYRAAATPDSPRYIAASSRRMAFYHYKAYVSIYLGITD
jgi:hypothetical protein